MSTAETEAGQQHPTEGEKRHPLVVVGVDGSEPSSVALAWAAEEARLRGAPLKVVHAWRLPSLAYMGPVVPEADFDALGKHAQTLVEAQVTDVLGDHPGIEVLTEVREGPSAQAVLDAAADADLLVVGSRGRGGFAGLLLGSVSSQIVHHARCPVVVVPAGR